MRKTFFSIIIVFGVFIDMLSKYIVEQYLHSPMPLLGDWLALKLSYNSGIAFSLPLQGVLLQIITLILIFAIIVYYSNTERPKKSKTLDFGYAMLLAGALSHGYERIFVGQVADFISVKYFAVFNFADIFISIGIIFLISYYVREPQPRA